MNNCEAIKLGENRSNHNGYSPNGIIVPHIGSIYFLSHRLSISSKVLPLVSGIKRHANSMVTTHSVANIKYGKAPLNTFLLKLLPFIIGNV